MIDVYSPTKYDVLAQKKFLEELIVLIEPYSDKPLLLGSDFNIHFSTIDKREGIIYNNYIKILVTAAIY